jgi:predicted MFS family arabinose efflux permease
MTSKENSTTEKVMKASLSNPAFRFIFLLGIANLFGDLTYEGGASLNGQFLSQLGSGAAAISIIAGFGEFLGYSLRSLSGYVADRTGKPWLITIFGYALNLFSVPAMAFAPTWQVAAIFIFTERIGRAIRKPTVEAMLSYTTSKYGRGWVYALNTALDETGATLGPLIVALILFKGGSYRFGYSIFLASSILTLVSIIAARIKFPMPEHLEKSKDSSASQTHFSKSYWTYMLAGSFFAAGMMSYELVAFHLLKKQILSEMWIPVLLAFATGSGVIANLVLGKLYDRFDIKIVVLAALVSAMFSPLAFFGSHWLVIGSMICLGVGYATQDTLLKAIVAGQLPKGRRNFAFGLFYTGYGVGWLVGSIATGILYEHSRLGLVIFVVLAQLASVPLFLLARRKQTVNL